MCVCGGTGDGLRRPPYMGRWRTTSVSSVDEKRSCFGKDFFLGGAECRQSWSLFRTLTACHSCRAVPEVSLVVACGHPVLRGGGGYLQMVYAEASPHIITNNKLKDFSKV